MEPQIPHGIYDGVDTLELEKRMRAVDWHKHPGHFIFSEDDPLDKQLAEMRSIERQHDRLCRIQDCEPAAVVWEYLMVKYYSGTPLQTAICETVPYLTASFKNNNYLNENTMNEQNLEYLTNNVKYLGFAEKTTNVMDTKIRQEIPEFQVTAQHDHFNNSVFYKLYFKKSDQSDMYFLNKYDATLSSGKLEDDRTQTFYINKGHGVTAKEAFNLLEGRAVYKTLENKEHQKYNVWMQLDFANKDERNNYKVNTFHDKYNYKLERALDKYNFVELNDPEKKAALMKSMQKGNTQQVTAIVDGKEVKAFVEASPEKRTINVYDEKMKPQEQAVYLKVPVRKDLAQEKAEKEAQKQAEGQTQGRKKSKGVHH